MVPPVSRCPSVQCNFLRFFQSFKLLKPSKKCLPNSPELVTHIALQCNHTTDGFADRCALRGSATVARHIPVLPCVRGTTELDVSDLLLYADLRGKQHIWAFHLQARRYVRIGTDPALLKRNIDSKPCPSARFYWPDNLFVWLSAHDTAKGAPLEPS